MDGGHEFGIYVYVLTWVMVFGGLVDIGLASSAQRFIPQYSEKGAWSHLRGFLSGSRWLTFWIAMAISAIGALVIHSLDHWLDEYTIVPLYIGCLILPVYGVMHVQDGIARSYNWPNLALLPPFVIRQLLVIGLMGAAYVGGVATDATTGIVIAAISIWACAIGQYVVLTRKLATEVPTGPKSYDIPRWISVSVPMFLVDSLYMLLMYVDVLILKQFRSPEEIAIYYAAAKTLALVSFVYFAVSAASAHKFSEYYEAGDYNKLRTFAKDAVRWTFWPSLAAVIVVLALGWPLLRLFGERFVTGYSIMFVLAIGILARAAIGPGERFLSMLGQQKLCALTAFVALVTNLGLCFVLIPPYGVLGAAISTSIAFIVESVMIFIIAKRRLGFHLFVWGAPRT
ncbi:lipopolysaccharide biosynthesis protein [Pseudorhodoplanes sinuspersici]|uniref:lipopolysaccharide biosynthesis protein n=1 Tax=Pseudorhodoplanes sinuspersici TaxID=1235591 RepID=UPI000A31FF3C|nr:lipopolysaccharide biosynthesis protein [Pseudorhodoplanes sinuspersici]